jgi:malate synthase
MIPPDVVKGIEVLAGTPPIAAEILSAEALAFLEKLHRQFHSARRALLKRRAERQAEFDAGALPEFLTETETVRSGSWKVADTPADLQKRWVEITGPSERKMMINALNSGADVFMSDFEDSLSPTWTNVVVGQANLIDAVRRSIEFVSPEGKAYRLNPTIATLLVRPRGWHLPEKHLTVDGEPISASLFDFGLYFFHNARERLDRGTGPYFYLPKIQSHREARLWNDVFVFAQDALGIPRGSVRATVLIETLPAAFEMEEILYELREHSGGLNAGRWDYLFSIIKTLSWRRGVLPDRAQVTMTVPFMRAYTELLIKTCHARGAHAMGGMAAFIPSRKDAEVNATALAKVRDDKLRESGDGFDGTWVAHPDLVPVAHEVFEKALGGRANQKERLREEVSVTAEMLVDTRVPGGTVTEGGLRHNVNVALQYLNSWLSGNGAAAIFNLMEDVATAEISRSQLWQWTHNGAKLSDGRPVTQALYETIRGEELGKLGGPGAGRLREAAEILDGLVGAKDFVEFLTLPAYGYLD